MATNKGRGSKLARSETVTVRLDPQLRYLAELGARKQRRSVSSFVEWAIQDALERIRLSGDTSIAQAARSLWDVDDADRFVKLAFRYPDLLTHTEQMLWKAIREYGFLWRGNWETDGEEQRWVWQVNERSLVSDRLRNLWQVLRKIVSGQADRSTLPEWEETRPTPRPDI